jgi:hypothetical protein
MGPTFMGGRDWPSGGYNPKTNAMFIPLHNLCFDTVPRADRDWANAIRLQRPPAGHPSKRCQCDFGRDRQDAVELPA